MTKSLFNLPNIITISRIILVPAFLVILYMQQSWSNLVATIFFVIAASTDFLDGYIARKYNLVTNLGKVLDPVADKIVVAAALIALVEFGRIPGWIVIIMLFRDFAVGALRDMSAHQGTIIAAGMSGKVKTVLQMVGIGFLFFYNSIAIWPLSYLGITTSGGISVPSGVVYLPTYEIGLVVIYVALVASVYSGIVYFRAYSEMLKK